MPEPREIDGREGWQIPPLEELQARGIRRTDLEGSHTVIYDMDHRRFRVDYSQGEPRVVPVEYERTPGDRQITLSWATAASLAFRCAGVGSGAIMSKEGPAGEVVMPTEEIEDGCAGILGELGIDLGQIEGYGSFRERHGSG